MSAFSYFKNTDHFYLYAKPINMQFGEKKLKELCQNEMGIDPSSGDLFLFFNKALNTLKLFYVDDSGSQELMRFLPNGGFILPLADEGKKYIKIPMSKLSRIFRQANFTVENFLDNITDILNHFHDQSEHV